MVHSWNIFSETQKMKKIKKVKSENFFFTSRISLVLARKNYFAGIRSVDLPEGKGPVSL